MLAIWTGQRQGDLLRLPWSAYDGTHIRLQQSKTGRRIAMQAGAPLKALLDVTERQCPVILTNTMGRPWTSDEAEKQSIVAASRTDDAREGTAAFVAKRRPQFRGE
jgi:hypothetical protein